MRDTIERMMRDGVGDAEIRTALLSAGWSERRVADAMSEWVRTPHGPVPKPHRWGRNFVKGAALLVLLTAVSWHAVSLCFLLIEHFLPSPSHVDAGPHWRFAFSWSVANLVILCPVLYGVKRRFRPFPDWTRNFGSLLVFAVLTGDAIAALHALLSGSGDAAFFAKCAVVVLVSLLARYALTGRDPDA